MNFVFTFVQCCLKIRRFCIDFFCMGWCWKIREFIGLIARGPGSYFLASLRRLKILMEIGKLYILRDSTFNSNFLLISSKTQVILTSGGFFISICRGISIFIILLVFLFFLSFTIFFGTKYAYEVKFASKKTVGKF